VEEHRSAPFPTHVDSGGYSGLQVIRDIAESKRDGNLEEETDRRERVGLEVLEAEAVDDGRGVGVEGSLGPVVAERDEEVNPEAPVAELNSAKFVSGNAASLQERTGQHEQP